MLDEELVDFEDQPSLHERVRDRGVGIWLMARVVPEWTYVIAYMPTLDARTCTDGWFWAFVVCFCTKGKFGPGTLVHFRQLRKLVSWRIALTVSGPYATYARLVCSGAK